MRVHSHEVAYTSSPDEQSIASQEDDAPAQDSPPAKVGPVYEALLAVYGRPTWRTHHPPMDQLVLTVLSQNTSDLKDERALPSLRRRFPPWAPVPHARAVE